MTAFDRDDLIRLALTPDEAVQAPADLADDIRQAIAKTPQRRSLVPWVGVTRWIPSPSRTVVLAAILGVLVIVGLLVAVASRRPSSPVDLTMYRGGPERTGILPGPGPRGVPSEAWQGDLHGPVPVQVMPIVHDGLVLVADGGGYLMAFAETDGTVRWEIDVESAVRSSPIIVGDLVVVGTGAGDLIAYELASQRERWRQQPGGPINASLVAVDGIVYAGSDDGNLYAVDARNGSLLATIPIGGKVTRGPAVSDGVIYIGSSSGTFVAIDAATRVSRWSRVLGAGETGTPSVADGTVYVPRGLEAESGPHDALALDIRDGATRWSFASPTDSQVYVGAVADGLVFAVSKDGFVYGLDAATGAVRWRRDTGEGIGALAGVVDGVLYVTNDGQEVWALDSATGDVRWMVPVTGIPSMAAVIDGRVIVATTLGKVVALADPPGAAPP